MEKYSLQNDTPVSHIVFLRFFCRSQRAERGQIFETYGGAEES